MNSAFTFKCITSSYAEWKTDLSSPSLDNTCMVYDEFVRKRTCIYFLQITKFTQEGAWAVQVASVMCISMSWIISSLTKYSFWISFFAGELPVDPRMRAASKPALVALFTATVATGTPRGIWTMNYFVRHASRIIWYKTRLIHALTILHSYILCAKYTAGCIER